MKHWERQDWWTFALMATIGTLTYFLGLPGLVGGLIGYIVGTSWIWEDE